MKRTVLMAVILGATLIMPALLHAETAPDTVTAKIYGFTKLDVILDTQRTATDNRAFYLLPLSAGQRDDELDITAKASQVGLDFAGPDTEQFVTTGKFEVDFFGGGTENAPNPRLRLAYVALALKNGLSLRFGQDWDAFIAVNPRIIDGSFLGSAGNLYSRRPQVRVSKDVAVNGVTVSGRIAAARTIALDIDGGGQDDGADSGTPTIESAIIFGAKLWTKKAAQLSISGESGVETLDRVSTTTPVAIVAPDVASYNSWAVIISAFLPLTEIVALQGTVWNGSNLDGFYGGINQGINKTLRRSIDAQGGWGQLVADITPAVNVNLGYGVDDPYDNDLNNGDRTLNTRIFASVFVRLSPAVTAAAEYSSLRTDYKNAQDATGDRYQGSLIYKF